MDGKESTSGRRGHALSSARDLPDFQCRALVALLLAGVPAWWIAAERHVWTGHVLLNVAGRSWCSVRIAVVEQFTDYAKQHPGVWFARRIEIARAWRNAFERTPS